jgi:hypothetical protein
MDLVSTGENYAHSLVCWTDLFFLRYGTTIGQQTRRKNSSFFIRFSFFFSLAATMVMSSCVPSSCGSDKISCSTNLECDCLQLVNSSSSAVCGYRLPCDALITCSSNNSCPTPGSICINSTHCEKLVCYPMQLALIQVCPSRLVTSTTTTVTATTTITRGELRFTSDTA